jgi:hypothetical protein
VFDHRGSISGATGAAIVPAYEASAWLGVGVPRISPADIVER